MYIVAPGGIGLLTGDGSDAVANHHRWRGVSRLWLHNSCTDVSEQGFSFQRFRDLPEHKPMIPNNRRAGREIAKPLYGLTPVPRVRIPPSPPEIDLSPSTALGISARGSDAA